MRIIKLALEADAKKPEDLDDFDVALQRIRDSVANEYGPLSPDEEKVLEKFAAEVNVKRDMVKIGVLEVFYRRFIEWARKSGLPKEFVARRTQEVANGQSDSVDIGQEMKRWEWGEEKKAITDRQPWIMGLAKQAFPDDPDLTSFKNIPVIRLVNNLDIRMGGLTPHEMRWLFNLCQKGFDIYREVAVYGFDVFVDMMTWARTNMPSLEGQTLTSVYQSMKQDYKEKEVLERSKQMDNTADFVANLSEGWKAWHCTHSDNHELVDDLLLMAEWHTPSGDHLYFLTDSNRTPQAIIGADGAPKVETFTRSNGETVVSSSIGIFDVQEREAGKSTVKVREFFDVLRSKLGLRPESATESSSGETIKDLETNTKASRQYGLAPHAPGYGGDPGNYVENLIEILNVAWDRDWSERQASGLVDDLFEYAYLRGEEGMIEKALESEPWTVTRGKNHKGQPIQWSGHGFYEYADQLWMESVDSNSEYFAEPDPDDDEFHDPDLSEAENKKKFDDAYAEYESRRDYAEEDFAPNRLVKMVQAELERMKKVRKVDKRRAALKRKKELAVAPVSEEEEWKLERERQMQEILQGVSSPSEEDFDVSASSAQRIRTADRTQRLRRHP